MGVYSTPLAGFGGKGKGMVGMGRNEKGREHNIT